MTKYSDLWTYGGNHSENTIDNIFLVRIWRNGNICRLMVTMWNEMAALWNSLVFSHILLPWTNANTNIFHNIPNQPNGSSVKEWMNTIWHTHTVEYCSDIMKYWLCWCTLETYSLSYVSTTARCKQLLSYSISFTNDVSKRWIHRRHISSSVE